MQRIAQSVGDWYFDREDVKAVDCPYPCDNTCHNLVFKWVITYSSVLLLYSFPWLTHVELGTFVCGDD